MSNGTAMAFASPFPDADISEVGVTIGGIDAFAVARPAQPGIEPIDSPSTARVKV
jgi:hypothetical protein